MQKRTAIALLGGSVGTAAQAIGISSSAVTQWPERLPDRLTDRVLAALAREHLPPRVRALIDPKDLIARTGSV